MTEFVSDLVESHHHQRCIQPYCGVKKELLEASTSNCRAAYNLYIGSIMNREVCFSPRIVEDERDLCSHCIGEETEYGSEPEFSVPTATLTRPRKPISD
jgi:hypothetical protein